MTSIYKSYMDAVKTEIAAMADSGLLPGFRKDEMFIRREPLQKDGLFYRGLTLVGGDVLEAAGTNERDDRGYPVHLIFSTGSDVSMTENWDVVPTWKEAIRRRFSNSRLNVTATGCNRVNCLVRDGKLFQVINGRRMEVSTLLITCWMREGRI